VSETYWRDKRVRIWAADQIQGSSSGAVGEVVAESESGIDVQTGEGALRITRLQLPGGKPMGVHDFIHGQSLLGQVLGPGTVQGQVAGR
ncbi:MAG: hypothetical protein AAF420_09420, partial [Pseudomonadota bacterium]